MDLPDPIAQAVQPLFDALPLDEAMTELAPRKGAPDELKAIVRKIIKEPPIAENLPLQSALWLYIDELDLSHEISQTLKDDTGSYWHGIMHRREGDFSNSHYWFNRAGQHPAMAALPGYDGHALVDEVAAARPANPRDVVRKQQEEWANLFAWCANQ
ncbi:MAG: hypothetical protein KF886_09270 [Candidatus Hydrogenedentes bacterium]|nr:hypothetical protein [Candidatus Hydrogenedentota bacterium]